MKLKVLIIVTIVVSSLYAFTRPSFDTNIRVYFMKSFNNDSVQVSTPTHSFSLRATGVTSVDTIPQLVIAVTTLDSTISIKDISRDNSYTVPMKRDNKYLFIYYSNNKFTFRFSNKLLKAE